MTAQDTLDIRKDIEKMHATLEDVRVAVCKINTSCEACRPMVEEHSRALNGNNGNIGLKAHSHSCRTRWKCAWAIMMMLAAAVVGLIGRVAASAFDW